MVPPPPESFLSLVGKFLMFLTTLPVTLPMMFMRLRDRFSQNSQSQYWNPPGGGQGYQGYQGYQDYQDYQTYQNSQDNQSYQNYQNGSQTNSNSSNQGYGKRMVWTYVPGYGWRYAEVHFGPEEERN